MEASSCSKAEPFVLQVLGDSMIPEFQDGVVIVIDPEGVVQFTWTGPITKKALEKHVTPWLED